MTEPTTPPTAAELEARRWAAICHLSALIGLIGNGVGFVLGPLIVWLIKRNDHPFLDEQGKEAVNFQITMFLAVLASIPLCFIVIGFFLLPIVVLAMIIFPIVAALRAGAGVQYLYPLSIRFLR